MSALIYYLSLPLIYAISLLPWWLLYRLSDVLYVVLYHVSGFRQNVVSHNLENSFPEKDPFERKLLEKRFYRYLCDLILESLKTLTIRPASVRKRVEFKDEQIFAELKEQGQSAIVVLGHYGNWELVGAAYAVTDYPPLYIIYHPLTNQYFERLIVHMRTRLGNGLYPMRQATRLMVENQQEVRMTAFIADQTPRPDRGYWMEFLNQDTPVFRGTAKMALELNVPVIYISITRPRRGFYELRAEKIVDRDTTLTEDQITELHTRRLEQDILKQPEIWLWTHRRWKHKQGKRR